jgi:transcriptional regulator with XRE-family HTH domain
LSALKVVTPTKVIRDAGYAQRLALACDRSDQCPPLHQGRLVWVVAQLQERFGLDVTTETVRKWMHGEAKPRLDKNSKLAELLGVDPVWLYQGIDPNLSPREKKARNAMADGAVNLIAGFIQMDGGAVAFPEENGVIDLYHQRRPVCHPRLPRARGGRGVSLPGADGPCARGRAGRNPLGVFDPCDGTDPRTHRSPRRAARRRHRRCTARDRSNRVVLAKVVKSR